jgi:Tol biopolymer transport system component
MRARWWSALLICGLSACERPEAIREVTQYSVADFYKNNDYFAAGFSADRARVLVGSNLSGVFNAYAIPVDSGAPAPLTASTTDAIFPVSFFPRDDRMLYSSDRGGNELRHLYLREVDGTVRDLTPGEKLQASFAGWAHDRASFFVSTNERDERFFDLYEYAVDGYRRTLIYRNTEGFLLGPVSRDKRHLALIKPYTTSDADVFLHDLTTGAAGTSRRAGVSNAPQDFARQRRPPDVGRGREFAALLRLDGERCEDTRTRPTGTWRARPAPQPAFSSRGSGTRCVAGL